MDGWMMEWSYIVLLHITLNASPTRSLSLAFGNKYSYRPIYTTKGFIQLNIQNHNFMRTVLPLLNVVGWVL